MGVGGTGGWDRRTGQEHPSPDHSPGVVAGPCPASACSDALPPEPTRQNISSGPRARPITLSAAIERSKRSSKRHCQGRKRVGPHTESALAPGGEGKGGLGENRFLRRATCEQTPREGAGRRPAARDCSSLLRPTLPPGLPPSPPTCQLPQSTSSSPDGPFLSSQPAAPSLVTGHRLPKSGG